MADSRCFAHTAAQGRVSRVRVQRAGKLKIYSIFSFCFTKEKHAFSRFGRPAGTKIDPRSTLGGQGGARRRPEAPKMIRKASQDLPKSTPRRPRSFPRGTRSHPRPPLGGPRVPKGTKKSPKSTPGRSKINPKNVSEPTSSENRNGSSFSLEFC